MSGNIEGKGVASAPGGLPEQLRENLHLKEGVCRELEALAVKGAADMPAEIERLTAAYADMPAVPEEYSEILDRRFREARTAAESAAAALATRVAGAVPLRAELDKLIAAGELVTLSEVEQLDRRWNELVATLPDPALVDAAGFESTLGPLREKLRAEAAREAEITAAAEAITNELIALTEGEDVDALAHKKDELETRFAALGVVPRAAQKNYHDAHRKAMTRLSQHYQTLDYARWESYTLKLDLCTELERLSRLEDRELPAAAKTLREIRERWKALGSVPREKNEEINQRYLELTRTLQHRIDEYFSHRRQEQKSAAAEKIALCAEAEALADSTEWNATADKYKELQARWKALPSAGSSEHGLFARFRAPADRFFTARKQWQKERNQRFHDAAERKSALCAEAEALTPGDLTRARQLREEFRAVPGAGRAEPELQRRFDAAMDALFSRRREEQNQREQKSRELAAELEQLATGDPLAALPRAREIRSELENNGCRNTRDLERRAINTFDKALNAARRAGMGDRLNAFLSAARRLAAAVAAGERPEPGDYADFPRLTAALNSYLAGDTAKLERHYASSRREYQRIISELEKLSDPAPAASGADSLAAELQAAILGNFAREEAMAARRNISPEKLYDEFRSGGLLPSEELEATFSCFEALRAGIDGKSARS